MPDLEPTVRPFVLREVGASRLRAYFREIGFSTDGVTAGRLVIGWKENSVRHFFNLGQQAAENGEVQLM